MNTKTKKLTITITILLMSTFFVSSCRQFQRISKNRFEEIWNRQQIENYRFTMNASCFCTLSEYSPGIVTVKNGVVESIVSKAKGKSLFRGQGNDDFDRKINEMYINDFPAIPKLFEMVQDAIDHDAYWVWAEYDSARGFPTKVSIEYDRQTTDDEFYFLISDVEPLNQTKN